MKHISVSVVTILLLAATVASGQKPVEVYRSGYSRVILIVVEGHKYLLFEGLDKGGITHAASCTNHAPTIVTNTIPAACERACCKIVAYHVAGDKSYPVYADCQRTHCRVDCGICNLRTYTPAPMPMPIPWSITNQPLITVPYIVTTNDLRRWFYSTNYVTSINANVEAP